jgi:hypothetical protein
VCAGSSNDVHDYVGDISAGAFKLLASVGNGNEHPMGFAAATPGASRILFETQAKLTPEAEPGDNLYLWDEARPPAQRVSLAGVLPGGTSPTHGSFAGPGGPAVFRPPNPHETRYYTQNTISADGSRIFFSDAETGFIYMREPDAERTIQVSAGVEPAFWRAATRDGDYVFYTENNELYRFNVPLFEASGKPESEALAEAREQLTAGAEGILGVLGISEDSGSYVYFAAQGVLATNTNGNNEEALAGSENVYQWHDGVTTFIVSLPGGRDNWAARWETSNAIGSRSPSAGERSSRVTPDGQQLLFSSTREFQNYNNNGLTEFYLYDSSRPLTATNPACVSCNPKGIAATGEGARLADNNDNLASRPSARYARLQHNLSTDGRRVFFETEEALVPGDANLGTKDVYEWEANGDGSCHSEAQDHGCLSLISTGQSGRPSYFGDASADGSDVFFFTREPLVAQDRDENEDLYDVRVEGGIPAQNQLPPGPPCAEETACRQSSPEAPPVFGTLPSTTFSGAGNLAAPPIAPSTTTKKRNAAQIRAAKLARALKACRAKPKTKRKSCKAAARRRYGPKVTATKTSRGGHHS